MTDDVERVSIDTTDAQTAADWLGALFPDVRLRPKDHLVGSLLAADVATSGGTSAGRFRMGMDMDGHTPPMTTFCTGVVLAGLVQVALGGRDGEARAVVPGEPWAWVDGADLDARWGPGSQTCVVQVPRHLLDEAAEATTGLPAGGLRVLGTAPVDEAAGRYWAHLVATTYRGLRGADPPLAAPLASRHWQESLASAALRVFPNTTLTAAADHLAGPGRAGPATVRRALAHAEAHAHEPIGVEDLARAAGIGVRALQLAYVQHVGCSPTAHLRRVRLQRAHAELAAAAPPSADGSGTSVAAVALRWGFTPGAFSAAYRAHYGRSPSTTLRA